MSVEHGRIGRFVAAARNLLLLQVLAAVLAVGVAAWAFVEVRGLATERDRLKAQVAELEAQRGAVQPIGPPAVPLGPDPAYNQMLPPGPPADLNLIVPPPITPDLNAAAPVAPPPAVTPPAAQAPEEDTPEPVGPVRRWDCSGANAQNPRCRPLMERPNLPLNNLEPRGPALGPGSPGGNQQAPR